MKYLKLFKTEADRTDFEAEGIIITPSIHFTRESKSVNYHPVQFIEEDNTHNGHEYVDLGLPSGLKWAKCNVGANNEYEVGDYFAWGEVETKTSYNWNTYKWGSSQNSMTKYNSSDNKITLDLEDDAASVNMGGSWRMPTYDELEELSKNLTAGQFITINNVVVREVESVLNGAKFYIPYGGTIYNSSAMSSNNYGQIWGSQRFSIKSSPTYLSSSKDFPNSPPSAIKSGENLILTPWGLNVRGVIKPNK